MLYFLATSWNGYVITGWGDSIECASICLPHVNLIWRDVTCRDVT